MDGNLQAAARGRRAGLVAAVLATLALSAPAAAAAASDFTWSGGASTPGWSSPANWSGGVAPSGSVGNLIFPALTSSACTANPQMGTCYQSQNDLSGITAKGLTIDDSTHGFTAAYSITGNGISLGAGGITAAPATGATGFGGATISLPITLTANQSWSIAGSSNHASLLLGGAVSGVGDTLGVNLSPQGLLNLTANDEVGAVTLNGNGANPGTLELGFPGAPGGSPGLGKLNATDGNAVNVQIGATLIGEPGETGPLAESGGQVVVGVPGAAAPGAQQLTVDGDVSLAQGTLSMFLNQAGTTAGTDYSQLSATGTVTIGSGETLNLSGVTGAPPQCPTLHAGDVLTLISATSLSGTFTNAADGSTLSLNCSGGTQPTVLIHYTSSTLTATVQTAGGTTPTQTALQAPTPSSPVADQPVTLSAQVTAGSGTPTGSVQFLDGSLIIPNCFAQPLSGNPATATCQTSFGAGGHSLTAHYNGGSGFSSSTSTPPTQLTVGQGSTTTGLSVSNANPSVGQSIIYTATVAPMQPGNAVTPTGDVQFDDGGAPIASCASQPLTSGGQAQCTISYSSPGGHSITASYPGDTNFTGSASSPAQTVSVSQPSAGVPVNTAPPTVSGSAQQGQTLTVTQGSWTNAPSSIGDQWLDCDASGAHCTPNGSTGHADTLTAADVGHTIRVSETASNAAGAGSPAASAPTGVVAALPPASPSPPTSSAPSPPLTLAQLIAPFSPPAPPAKGLRILANPHSGVVVGPELPSGNHSVPVQTSGACVLSLSELPIPKAGVAARHHRGHARRAGLIKPVTVAVASAGVHDLPLIPTRRELRRWRRLHRHGRRAHSTAAQVGRDPVGVRCTPVSFKLVSFKVASSHHVTAPQGTAPVQTGASPQATSPPVISGDSVRGHTVTFEGSFTGHPSAVSFQWEDCRGNTDECAAIPGTRSDPSDQQSYTVQGSDVGFALRVLFFATNSTGTTEGETGPTSIVTGVSIPPQAVFTAEQLLDGDSIVLGGLDLDGYCRLQGFARSQLDPPGGLYDWFCVGGPGGERQAIETTTACQFEYQGLSVEAVGDANTNLWTCREHGTGAGRAGTGRIDVPPPPPPTKPLCRFFGSGNAAGSISGFVCNNQLKTLDATIFQGACNTETAHGNSSTPIRLSASLLGRVVPVSLTGEFSFNFTFTPVGGFDLPNKTFNGRGQIFEKTLSAIVGIGTGPVAVNGGFEFCTGHTNFF